MEVFKLKIVLVFIRAILLGFMLGLLAFMRCSLVEALWITGIVVCLAVLLYLDFMDNELSNILKDLE